MHSVTFRPDGHFDVFFSLQLSAYSICRCSRRGTAQEERRTGEKTARRKSQGGRKEKGNGEVEERNEGKEGS